VLIYQPSKGYIYNSDTIFLYDFVSKLNFSGEILDVGSGSGVLGLLLARDFHRVNLSQVEIQDNFIYLSKKNAEVNRIDTFMYEGDFLEIGIDKKFDLIVSNPPFYHGNVIKSKNEMLKIARYRDSLEMEPFFKKVNRLLKPKGLFCFCYDAKQIVELLVTLNRYKMSVEYIRFVHSKILKDANLVMIAIKKSSKSLCKTLAPLVVFDGEKFSDEVNGIYKRANTYTIKV